MKTDSKILGMVLVGLAGIVAACQMTQEVRNTMVRCYTAARITALTNYLEDIQTEQ